MIIVLQDRILDNGVEEILEIYVHINILCSVLPKPVSVRITNPKKSNNRSKLSLG